MMKSFRNMAFSGLLTLGAFSAMTFTSCNSDKCKDVVCQNSGTCDEGNCTCQDGYEGNLCQTESREKFTRAAAWSASDVASGQTISYSVIMTKGAGNVRAVDIDNSFADDFFLNNVKATVSGNVITIASQEPDNDGYKVAGSGTYASGAITWNYSITPPSGPVVNLTGTWR